MHVGVTCVQSIAIVRCTSFVRYELISIIEEMKLGRVLLREIVKCSLNSSCKSKIQSKMQNLEGTSSQYTLSGLIYLHTTNLKCITCVIYSLSAKLGSKKEIETCKYIKYDVSALTWVKISNFLVFREVLIY